MRDGAKASPRGGAGARLEATPAGGVISTSEPGLGLLRKGLGRQVAVVMTEGGMLGEFSCRVRGFGRVNSAGIRQDSGRKSPSSSR